MTGAIHQYYTSSLSTGKELTRGNNYSLRSFLTFLKVTQLQYSAVHLCFISPEISPDL